MSESGYLHWSNDPFEKMVIFPLDPLTRMRPSRRGKQEKKKGGDRCHYIGSNGKGNAPAMAAGLQVPAAMVEVEGERESRGCPTMTTMTSSYGLDGGGSAGGRPGQVINERQLMAEVLAGQDSLASNDNDDNNNMNFIGVIKEGGFFTDVSALNEGLLHARGNHNDNKAEEGLAQR
jgi:hypothetical protein